MLRDPQAIAGLILLAAFVAWLFWPERREPCPDDLDRDEFDGS